jgi:hypothetical protein
MECPICLNSFTRKKNTTILDCKHKYCSKCIKEYARIQSKTFGGKFKCPVPNCNNIFNPDGLIGQRLLKQYKDRNSRMSAYPCPWKKCKGTLNHTAFCETCRKQSCNTCLEKTHFGSCNSEIVNSINSVYRNKSIKFCPNCHTAISKNGGCSNMICMKCGTGFNWQSLSAKQIYNFDHYQDRLRPGSQNSFPISNYNYHNYRYNNNQNQTRYPYSTNTFNHYNFKDMEYSLNQFGTSIQCIECGIDTCMLERHSRLCCWCRDKKTNNSQLLYDDDLGLIELNNYWESYCPTCNSLKELKLEGILTL